MKTLLTIAIILIWFGCGFVANAMNMARLYKSGSLFQKSLREKYKRFAVMGWFSMALGIPLLGYCLWLTDMARFGFLWPWQYSAWLDEHGVEL
jgi:hypothetical protein